jgi:hypothetical protein
MVETPSTSIMAHISVDGCNKTGRVGIDALPQRRRLRLRIGVLDDPQRRPRVVNTRRVGRWHSTVSSSGLGDNISLTVEVRADSPTGFDDSTRRTVSENAANLNATAAEFEQGSV